MSTRTVGSKCEQILLAIILAGLFLAPWSGAAADSFEPNDTSGQAYPIPNGVVLESWISSPIDVDWYTFTTSQTGTISISMGSLPFDYDVQMGWYNPATQQIETTDEWVSENSGTSNELIQDDVTVTGTFYILVWAYFSDYSDSDSYLLSASYPGGGGNQPPDVTVSSPNGGESWTVGSVHAISYTATDPDTPSGNLTLSFDYSTNGGTSWIAIASGQSNTGSYSWTVPNAPTTQARVRATVSDGQSQDNDTSNGNFTIQGGPPPGDNTLSVGTGSGASGSQVAVALSLANEDVVKALQTDIQFNPAVVSFVSGAATGRGAGMSFSTSVVGGNTVRVVMYYADQTTLAAGTGALANLTFSLIGANGTQTALTPTATVLSDPQAEPLDVVEQAGSITVGGTPNPPVLQIAALKNPGRVRTVQIFVLSDQSLSALTVTANGTQVTMALIDGAHNIYHAIVHAANDAANLAITATGTGASGQGVAQATVNF